MSARKNPGMGAIIREALPADAAAIARVHVDSWRTTYGGIVPADYLASLSYSQREKVWRNILTHPYGSTYVALDDRGTISGFAGGGPERDADPTYKGELYGIYLFQEHQRRGIGTRLTSTVARQLLRDGFQSMLVWVLEANPSCRFYEALGGVKVKQRHQTIGGATLAEVAYGWLDIKPLADLVSS